MLHFSRKKAHRELGYSLTWEFLCFQVDQELHKKGSYLRATVVGDIDKLISSRICVPSYGDL